MNKKFASLFLTIILSVAVLNSCSKSDSGSNNTDPCAGKTILISGVVTPTASSTSATGALTISASGSTGFTFSNGSGAYQVSGNFSGLAAGNYTINAKDAAGCVKSQVFTVTVAACPTIAVTGTTTSATSSTSANGAINATATGSTGFTYRLDAGAFQPTGVFTSLTTGTYLVTAKDANGCTGTHTFVVSNAACPTITVSVVSTQTSGPAATNGTVTASATGGASPYQFSINSGAFQAGNLFSNMAVGSYTVVAKDANGCLGSVNGTVTSVACPTITVSFTTTPTSSSTTSTGTVTVTASGGTSPYLYAINGSAFQTSNLFSNMPAGTFTVAVRDINGCQGSASGSITVASSSTVTINIASFAYNPSPATVNVGTVVKWKNLDGAPHTATSDTGIFDTGTLTTGSTSSGYTATTPGTYPYHCLIHGTSMAGTLIVIP